MFGRIFNSKFWIILNTSLENNLQVKDGDRIWGGASVYTEIFGVNIVLILNQEEKIKRKRNFLFQYWQSR